MCNLQYSRPELNSGLPHLVPFSDPPSIAKAPRARHARVDENTNQERLHDYSSRPVPSLTSLNRVHDRREPHVPILTVNDSIERGSYRRIFRQRLPSAHWPRLLHENPSRRSESTLD